MNYIYDSQVVNKIAKKILEPKNLYYTEDQIHMTLLYLQHITYHDFNVQNIHGQKLKASLFKSKTTEPQTCILFMHGFGSNRIQALNILPYLPKEFALSCFDFSAEGKSQGKIVTYGQKQKNDIHAVLSQLRNMGFKKFVLWGRSMGASCSLNFSLSFKPDDIFLQVLDSPFCSFSQVALEIAKKRVSVPEALLNLGLEVIKKNCEKQENSPFLLDFNKTLYCQIPTIFVYNLNDEVVCYKNSETIINNFKGHYEKYLIEEKHNSIRTAKTLKTIVSIIKKYAIKRQKKGKFFNHQKNHQSSKTEKVKFVFQKIPSPKNGINLTESYSHPKLFDNYGIWVSSRYCEKSEKQQHRPGLNLVKSEASLRKKPQSIEVVSAEVTKSIQIGRSAAKNRLTQSTASTRFYDQSHDKRRKLNNDFYL